MSNRGFIYGQRWLKWTPHSRKNPQLIFWLGPEQDEIRSHTISCTNHVTQNDMIKNPCSKNDPEYWFNLSPTYKIVFESENFKTRKNPIFDPLTNNVFFFDPNVFDLLKSVFDPLLLWLVSGSKCSHISDLVHKYQSGSKCLRVLFWKSIEHYLSREFLLISVTWWNGHMMIITRRRTNLRIQNLTFETH